MPVSRFTRRSHASASMPTPSNPPGLVRGFHTPARKMRMPSAARARAVASTCSSVSALHGPAMIVGRCAAISGNTMGNRSFISVWSAAALRFCRFFAPGRRGGRRLRMSLRVRRLLPFVRGFRYSFPVARVVAAGAAARSGWRPPGSRIFWNSTSSSYPSGVASQSRLMPDCVKPALRKSARLARFVAPTPHHS